MGGFPQLVHNEIRNLKTGISIGFTASKPAVERVMKQIQLMISGQAEESPFMILPNEITMPYLKRKLPILLLQN